VGTGRQAEPALLPAAALLSPGPGEALPVGSLGAPAASHLFQADSGSAILLGGGGDELVLGDHGRDVLLGGFVGNRTAGQTLPEANHRHTPASGQAPPSDTSRQSPGQVPEAARQHSFFETLPITAPEEGIAAPGADDLALGLALALVGAAVPLPAFEETDERN
jgi:hypothetical protein